MHSSHRYAQSGPSAAAAYLDDHHYDRARNVSLGPWYWSGLGVFATARRSCFFWAVVSNAADVVYYPLLLYIAARPH